MRITTSKILEFKVSIRILLLVFNVFCIYCNSFSQSIVAFEKAIGFSESGNSYFISEATFDSLGSFFPFKFKTKEVDISGNYKKTFSDSTKDAFLLRNSHSFYYFMYRDSNDSSFLYQKDVFENQDKLIASFPYSINGGSTITDYNAKEQLLFILQEDHPQNLVKVDLINRQVSLYDLGFLQESLQNVKIKNIGSYDASILVIDYKFNKCFKTIVADLAQKKIINNSTYTTSIKNVITKLSKDKIISITGESNTRGEIDIERTSIRVFNLESDLLALKVIPVDGLPDYFNVYDYETDIKVLLTYIPNGTTVGTEVQKNDLKISLNYESYAVTLFSIENR